MSIVRATETLAFFTDWGVVGVQKDQPFQHDDPLVKLHPEKFAADDEAPKPRRTRNRDRVEQATAAPGELRQTP